MNNNNERKILNSFGFTDEMLKHCVNIHFDFRHDYPLTVTVELLPMVTGIVDGEVTIDYDQIELVLHGDNILEQVANG